MKKSSRKTTPNPEFPSARPLRTQSEKQLQLILQNALAGGDGVRGAHAIHELWMRGAMAVNIDAMLDALWKRCATTVPEWLPMRHIEILPLVYEVASRFTVKTRGRSNIYLVLLDYRESRAEQYGVYVGATTYSPTERFEQHKAGIRAAGSVLKRGIEVLHGPTLHLQKMRRADAERIEVELAEALAAEGLMVQGGH